MNLNYSLFNNNNYIVCTYTVGMAWHNLHGISVASRCDHPHTQHPTFVQDPGFIIHPDPGIYIMTEASIQGIHLFKGMVGPVVFP